MLLWKGNYLSGAHESRNITGDASSGGAAPRRREWQLGGSALQAEQFLDLTICDFEIQVF